MKTRNSHGHMTEEETGAYHVLTAALHVERDDVVLIIHDEHTRDVAAVLDVIGRTRIGANVQLFPIAFDEQSRHLEIHDGLLSSVLRTRIDSAAALVVLQRRHPAVNGFRHSILEYSKNSKTRRAASMPGFEMAHFHFCRKNLDPIRRRCRLLASLLSHASCATIHTHSDAVLDIPLGKFTPIQSTGDVPRGDWSNVPSGETFIVPNLHCAEGSVYINTSLLDCPLKGNEGFFLNIAGGIVRSTRDVPTHVRQFIERLLLTAQGREAYPNCTVLAELGIGTNPWIRIPTGLPMLDEKLLGTAHLGFGRSTQFGGPTECSVHNDFTFTPLLLTIDNTAVLRDGKFILTERLVNPNWKNESPLPDLCNSQFTFGAETTQIVRGALHLTWESPRGGAMRSARVGDMETARLAAKLVLKLPRNKPESYSVLAAETRDHIPAEALLSIVSLLLRYRIIARV